MTGCRAQPERNRRKVRVMVRLLQFPFSAFFRFENAPSFFLAENKRFVLFMVPPKGSFLVS